MSERDLPNGTAVDEPLSFDEGVAGLEGILDGPETDPDEKQEVQNAPAEADEATAEDDEADMSDELEDDEESEDQDEEDDDQDEAETLELSDDLEIDLGDGRKATLADLKDHFGQVQKRVADFQRDYTQKTDALAQDRKAVETQSQRVMQWAEQVKQQRDMVLSFQKQYMPQPPSPDMMDEDPVGYMRAKADYEQFASNWQRMQVSAQQEYARQQALQQQNDAQELETARVKMLEMMPELGDPQKMDEFRQTVHKEFAPAYGFTSEEVASVRDPRFAQVMRDAIAYRKLKADQPKAKARIANKPPVLQSGKSMSAKGKAAQDKKAKADALRRTGSLEAGIDALMDLDL